MKLARDGIPTITFLVLASAAFALVSPVPAVVMAVLAVLVIWFYRDPDRTAPEEDGLFVSLFIFVVLFLRPVVNF